MVGTIRIRHYLTDALRTYGGHIGYAIAPAYRRKGYAKLMLSEACKKAKELGIEQLLIDPHCDNIASRHVVESCGGVLEKENDHTASYWISL